MDGNVTKQNVEGSIVSIPRIDESLEREGYAADAKKTGDELNARVKKTDIVDNLTSEDADKPLSARQGKEIKKQLDAINMSQAGTVGYDNSASGLDATNMQTAVDELASDIKTQAGYIDDLANQMDNYEQDYLSKKGGGMVTGSVKVQNAVNGHGELSKNNSATADYGTQMVDVSKDGKSAKVAVSAANNTFVYTDRDGNIRNIHHEGSKPFFSYTGNGNAGIRNIATGGFGRLALVYCSTHQALVSPKGADVVDLTTGTRSWIDSGKVNFLNGTLQTITANDAFNKAGETYYIQVL